MVAGVLDGAQLQHARARGRHLEHLLERDDVELACVRHDARVGAVDAGDVGVDLADVGADGSREGDGSGVRATAAERGHVLGGAHALEAGDEHDLLPLERLVDAVRTDVQDARLGVRRVGDDPGLRPCEGDGPVTEIVDGHGAQGAGHPLPGGEEHVHLARIRRGRDLLGHRDQLVGGLAASRQHARRRACPSSRARTMRAAARLMRSASATEVPPNFITTVPGIGGRILGVALGAALLFAGCHDEPSQAGHGGQDGDAAPHPPSRRLRRPRRRRRSRPVPAAALKRAAKLPLEQRVGQLFVVGFDGIDLSAPVFAELADHGWGGIFVGPTNVFDLTGRRPVRRRGGGGGAERRPRRTAGVILRRRPAAAARLRPARGARARQPPPRPRPVRRA